MMTPTLTTIEQPSTVLQPIDRRELLLSQIRGQTARIPDLTRIFSDWKGIETTHISPYVEPLRQKVRERIQSLSFSSEKQDRLKKADFALFTCLWWPEAPLERLEILAYLVIWLFTWDDEIDEPTGTFSENLSGAQSYRDQTLQFVTDSLGLGSTVHNGRTQNHLVQSFDVIGAALRACYDTDQVRRFRDEIERFMKASETEQRVRLRGEIPTIEEYWAFRLGTSAVYIGTAAGEYSMSARLPLEMMECRPMRVIWDETNVIISITNDLLSLRKEIRVGAIDSIVPLTFATTSDLDESIMLSVAALQASKERFDEAAAALLDAAAGNKDLCDLVREFIEVQRSNCVGNMMWSLETQRYGVASTKTKDQSLEFIF